MFIIIGAVLVIIILSVAAFLLHRKFVRIDDSYNSLLKYNQEFSAKSNSVVQELNLTDQNLKGVDSTLNYVQSELLSNDQKLMRTLEDEVKGIKDETVNKYVSKNDLSAAVSTKSASIDNLIANTIKGKSVTAETGKLNTLTTDEMNTLKFTTDEAVFSSMSGKKINTLTAKVGMVDAETITAANGFLTGINPTWRWGADDHSGSFTLTHSINSSPVINVNSKTNGVDVSGPLKGQTVKGGIIDGDFMSGLFVQGEVVYSDIALVAGHTPSWAWLANDKNQTFSVMNEDDMSPYMSLSKKNKNVMFDKPIAMNTDIEMRKGTVKFTQNDPGSMLEKNNGSDGNRFGFGLYEQGAVRVYGGSDNPSSSVSMSFAKNDGSFDDVVKVTRDKRLLVRDTICVGDTCMDGNQFAKLKNLVSKETN